MPMPTLLDVLLCPAKTVDGRVLPPDTLRRSLRLFEGKPVHLHHCPRTRRPADVAGRVVAPRVADAGVVGDVRLADTPAGKDLARIAAEASALFGCSPWAKVRWLPEGKGRPRTAGALLRVDSVDIVSRPASGKGLFGQPIRGGADPRARRPASYSLSPPTLHAALLAAAEVDCATHRRGPGSLARHARGFCGLPVFSEHRECRRDPDPLGVVVDAWAGPGGEVLGDVALEPAHPAARRLLEALRRGEPPAVGFSPLLQGWVGERRAVLDIARVEGLDLCASPVSQRDVFGRPLRDDYADVADLVELLERFGR